jgi:hypothetical protein
MQKSVERFFPFDSSLPFPSFSRTRCDSVSVFRLHGHVQALLLSGITRSKSRLKEAPDEKGIHIHSNYPGL